MRRFLNAVILGVVAVNCARTSNTQTISGAVDKSAIDTRSSADSLPPIPPLPAGRSTAVGGKIEDVDPVLDRFTLRVFGQKPMKILFDGRTQLFLDGKRIPLSDLHPSDHASVQTALDGASVFAISIHLLSQSALGDYQGRVLSYNSTTGELTVGTTADRSPFTIAVSRNTTFLRKGQDSFSSVHSGPSDLQRGSLVSIAFDSDNRGHAVANQITVLATPGAKFVFGGDLTAMDMHSSLLVLVDPRDQQTYQIHFNSTNLPVTQDLRVGQRIRVAAEYDGVHYQARDISVY